MSDNATAPNVPGYNILTLIKRLEAATSRLEDLTVYQADSLKAISDSARKASIESPDSQISKELPASGAAVAGAAAGAAAVSATGPSAAPVSAEPPKEVVEPDSPSIAAFDDFSKEFVAPYLTASKAIGELVEKQAEDVEAAITATRRFLQIVAKSKKPALDNPTLAEQFATIIKPLTDAVNVKDSKDARLSKLSNHLATVADGASAFSWFSVDKPVPFIGEFKDSAQFFANKVLKEYRGTDQQHVDWVQSFLKMLTGLQAYVKQYHTTGPAWNSSGVDIAEAVASQKSSPAPAAPAAAPAAPAPPAAGGPPPPPPPPPPPATLLQDPQTDAEPASAGGMSAVFADLNRGDLVTKGLKKVDKSQMTHKNPELRKLSTGSIHKPTPPKKPASLSTHKHTETKKPARKSLEDGKWFIENYENESSIIIEAEISQSIFIDRCVNSTVQIKGKANAITVNSCTGVGVLAESLVSGVDFIKCKKFGFQTTGVIPTISVDQSDSGNIYLSKESLGIEIYTSQSTSLNIDVPKEEEGDFDEVPVPEQLLHKIGPNGKLVSSIVEHAG